MGGDITIDDISEMDYAYTSITVRLQTETRYDYECCAGRLDVAIGVFLCVSQCVRVCGAHALNVVCV